MVFSSSMFIFGFLPIVLFIHSILKNKWRNIWLLLTSFLFFMWAQPNYLWIICMSILINYLGGLLIGKFNIKVFRSILLGGTIGFNLLLLFYYKYFNFFCESVNKAFHVSLPLKEIVLPIGISFFTFQGMSYVIDVYRKSVKVQKNPLKVALYIALFPQLVAGPIVRYDEVEKDIEGRVITIEDFYYGIKRFILGLGKKAVLANSLAVVVDGIWNQGVDQNTVAIAWLGAIGYSLQIYFDFSGYSDMAIGLGRMMGFHFCENFRFPYISCSITEFWRRWHISLSSWFKDYVYIPLGGNRKHVYINLAIVFLLTGIWHGAAWNFVLWGVWHGGFILVERYLKNKNISLYVPRKIRRVILHVYTLFVVTIGWILFRADNISNAWKYIKTMFGLGLGKTPGFSVGWYLNKWVLVVLVVSIISVAPIFTNIYNKVKEKVSGNVIIILESICLWILFGISIIRIVSGTYNPFIYFRF